MAKTKQRPTAEGVASGLRESLEALRDKALEEIEVAKTEAERVEARYWTAREELEAARTHLREIRQEYEALPMRSHTARMRGAEDAEDELNQRFRALEEEIPQVESRVRSLRQECDELVHGSARALPSAGASAVAHGPALRTAQPHRDAFDALQEQIAELIEETREPVDKEHADLLALITTQSARVDQAYREGGYQNAQEVPKH